jgi:actin-related protein 2
MIFYTTQILKGKNSTKKIGVHVEDSPYRKHSVFQGGAILADVMKDRDEFWMSRKQYEEVGISVLPKSGFSAFVNRQANV